MALVVGVECLSVNTMDGGAEKDGGGGGSDGEGIGGAEDAAAPS